jgi:hypothetical protein
MGVHQTEEFLYINENSHQTQVTAYRMGEKSLPDTHTTRDSYPESTGNSKKLSPQRINTLFKKWVYDLHKEFSKEELQRTIKYMKKCSSSLIIKEMKIKTTLTFPLTQVRMAMN